MLQFGHKCIFVAIYIYLKIEYQSETDFIYHENLRFKRKEKSLRKIKESKRMTKTQWNTYKIIKQSAYSRKKKVALTDMHIFNTYSS